MVFDTLNAIFDLGTIGVMVAIARYLKAEICKRSDERNSILTKRLNDHSRRLASQADLDAKLGERISRLEGRYDERR